MAKINIRALVAEMSADFLAEHKLELYNVEFQKEGKDWFLRVYIDTRGDRGIYQHRRLRAGQQIFK